jgi:tRNA nucleotidyltransferase (CCA-adding enzyme)
MKNIIKKMVRQKLLKEDRVKLNIPIPDDILQIKDVFVNNGYKLYIVGGSVRDSLLNKPIKDYDLATNATPDQVEEIMNKAGFKTLPTGKAFGVINVFTDTDEYEIATFRSDGEYSDSRRPDSVTFSDINTDSKRRDLTINALYYDIDTKEVIDLVGGINDIKKGIIRTVGKPEDRFKEDKLRILRSIRFAGRFGSQLDPNIDKVLSNDNSLIGVSPERIRDEFLKTIKSAKSIQQVFLLIDKYKLWNEIFPGININKKFVESKDPIIVISTLMLGNEPSSLSKILNKLTYSISENKAITFLISFSAFNDINNVYKMKKLFNASNVTDEQLREFNNINNILPNNIVDTFINFKLSVTGDQVQKELGIKPGPEMGKTIEKMEINNFKKLL